MSKSHSTSSDPNILAILHRGGKVWRGLVCSNPPRIANGTGDKSPLPSIIASREFASDQLSLLDSWLNEQHVGAVLCVIPSSAVICRNCSLPDASPDQLTQALQLQAEAHLLGIAPPHRLAMAVLPKHAGETTRTGLVLAWPDAALVPVPPTDRPMHFVPDIAALAALLNGTRPAEVPLFLDREDGSVALAVSHSAGIAFRATREEPQSTEDWKKSIGRIAAESALGVGHTGAFVDQMAHEAQRKAVSIQSGESRLFLPNDLLNAAAARLHNAPTDERWWSAFGIAAGALLARTGPLAAFTRMQNAPASQRPTLVGSVVHLLSRPQMAVFAVVGCIALVMFGPLAFNGIRLLILNARFSDVQTQLVAATTARQQVAVYQELERQKVWSMTKLLADLACYTPIGIELESIRIEQGKECAISGTAIATDGKTPVQLVAAMKENLLRHGMFSDLGVTAGKTDNLGRYRFDITAKVAKPYAKPTLKDVMDFASNTYAVRLYGEAARTNTGRNSASGTTSSTNATNTQPVASANTTTSDPAAETPNGALTSAASEDVSIDIESHEARIRSGPRIGGSDVANPAVDQGSGSSSVNRSAVPPPLDAEQVKVMSVAELKDALSKIGKARQSRDLDKETQDRLKTEWNLVMEHLRKAPAQ